MCDAFVTRACTDPWCVTAAAATSIAFVETAGPSVTLSVDALQPALGVGVQSGSVAPGGSAPAVTPSTVAVPTNNCFRIPLQSTWTGSPSGGWTEVFGAVLAKY